MEKSNYKGSVDFNEQSKYLKLGRKGSTVVDKQNTIW